MYTVYTVNNFADRIFLLHSFLRSTDLTHVLASLLALARSVFSLDKQDDDHWSMCEKKTSRHVHQANDQGLIAGPMKKSQLDLCVVTLFRVSFS